MDLILVYRVHFTESINYSKTYLKKDVSKKLLVYLCETINS